MMDAFARPGTVQRLPRAVAAPSPMTARPAAAAGRFPGAHRRESRAVPARRRCGPRVPRGRRGAAALGHSAAGLTMYVAVKGGERAIENAHALLADARRGDRSTAEISLDQI